jgi:Chromo (CHRromatin Organisation MOdifier) domain
MVQSVLNDSSSTRMNKRTPMQVFTGHAETSPLALILKDNVPVNAPLDIIKAQKLMEVEKLSKAMTEIHAQVAEKATRDRNAAIQKHNDKKHVRSPNFQVGDYVLVAELRKSGVSNFQVKWKGPRRVASVESDYVFFVENHKLYVVSKVLDARYNEQEMFHELFVAWRDFPVGEATWEPYSVMVVDVPDMVAKFMASHEDIDTVRKMRSL